MRVNLKTLVDWIQDYQVLARKADIARTLGWRPSHLRVYYSRAATIDLPKKALSGLKRDFFKGSDEAWAEFLADCRDR